MESWKGHYKRIIPKGKYLETLFYTESYEQEKVVLIFKHLEESIYMSKDDGEYMADVELTEGEHYYKYLLDDGLELIDKENKDICIDDGNCWSVLIKKNQRYLMQKRTNKLCVCLALMK